jgi:hypothetical protein
MSGGEGGVGGGSEVGGNVGEGGLELEVEVAWVEVEVAERARCRLSERKMFFGGNETSASQPGASGTSA